MKKKILIMSILAVFILFTVSLTAAINIKEENKNKLKASPLFSIRTKIANGDNTEVVRNILNSRFVGKRLFIMSFILQNFIKQENSQQDRTKDSCESWRPSFCPEKCPLYQRSAKPGEDVRQQMAYKTEANQWTCKSTLSCECTMDCREY